MVSGVLCLFVDWQRALTDYLRQEQPTYTDLGRTLLGCVSVLGTPLGLFYQRYCDHVQPPPATEAYHQRRGDLLPIHLRALKVGEDGTTVQNIDWMRLTVALLDFNYCTGWTKAICVPIDPQLSENQRRAIQEMARTVDDNIIGAEPVASVSQERDLLASKRFDYAGNPVEYMEDLVAKKVFPTWPQPGEAGVRCISDFLNDEGADGPKALHPPT